MTAHLVSAILCIVYQDDVRETRGNDTIPSTVAVGKHNHIARESTLDDTG
jgi:hypothetical protein